LGHLDFDIVSDLDIRISDFASLAPLHLSRNLYKSALFMQNKPNFLKSQMNVNDVLTKDYEKRTLGERGKNKPNQTQFQTGHLLVNRAGTKFLNFRTKNSLTDRHNSLKCWFLVVNGRLL
jgi:hypothetical protein